MPRSSFLTVLALCLVVGAAAGDAVPTDGTDAISVPRLINYQGKLTDADGNPINGTRTFALGIYDQQTGGNEYWTETQSNVLVSGGLFNIILGSVNPIQNLPDGPNCWLAISVNGVPITPRVRLVSVPYAYNADDSEHLGGIPSSGYALVGHVHGVSTGGTGRVTLDANRLLMGAGTNPVVSFPAGDSGQFLRSHGFGNAPTWETVQLEFMPFGTLYIQNPVEMSPNSRATFKVHVIEGLPFEIGDIVRIGLPTNTYGEYTWPEDIVVVNSGYVMRADTAQFTLWNMHSSQARTVPAGGYSGQLYIKYHGTDGRATSEPVRMGVAAVTVTRPEAARDE